MGVSFYCSAKSSTNYYIKNLITISTQLKCHKKHTHEQLDDQYSTCENRQQDKDIPRFPLNFSAEPEPCCIDYLCHKYVITWGGLFCYPETCAILIFPVVGFKLSQARSLWQRSRTYVNYWHIQALDQQLFTWQPQWSVKNGRLPSRDSLKSNFLLVLLFTIEVFL